MLAAAAASVGCNRKAQQLNPDAGTTAAIVLPETNPPVIDKALADSLTPGMPQDQAVAVLQSAAKRAPATGSLLDNVADQAKLNGVRYDLTMTQGKSRMVLKFRDRRLVDVQKEGLE